MKKKKATYSSKPADASYVSESGGTYISPSNNYEEIFQKVWATLDRVGQRLDEITEKQKKFEEEQAKRKQEEEKRRQEEEKRRAKEWEEYKKENQRRIQELQDLFTSQWGKLIEALLSPGSKKIFQERGINIHYRGSNIEGDINGQKIEIDVLLENDKDVVVVEVKTTAKVRHVNELIELMKNIKTYFPRFKDKNVYGAIAAVKFHEESDKYAASKGLFVIEPNGDELVKIKNNTQFKPKKW